MSRTRLLEIALVGGAALWGIACVAELINGLLVAI